MQDNASSTTNPITGACYVGTNNADFSNVGDYTLAGGGNLFDIGIIFAANLNGTPEKPELYFNSTVTEALESGVVAEMQAKGIKVLLSILNNHTTAGLSTLVNGGPKDFADQLSTATSKYGLDGFDFDDEYSNGTPNPSSFVELTSALRANLPSALLSFYFYGPAANRLSYGGVQVGDLIDYSWNAVYGTYSPPAVPGLADSGLAPAAVTVNPQGQAYTPPAQAVNLAKQTLASPYGSYMYFDLPNGDQSNYLTQVSQELYDQETIYTG